MQLCSVRSFFFFFIKEKKPNQTKRKRKQKEKAGFLLVAALALSGIARGQQAAQPCDEAGRWAEGMGSNSLPPDSHPSRSGVARAGPGFSSLPG